MQFASELIDLGRRMAQAGLTWGSSGNLSIRTPDGLLMTASGTRIPSLEPEDLLVVDEHGDVLSSEDGKRPSKEASMHLGVFGALPHANVVAHASPAYTTYVSCSDLDLPWNAFPEGMMHLAEVVRIPYEHAGSRALADAVAARCPQSQVLILENHGAIVWAKSTDDALLKLEVLEFASRMAVFGSMTGVPAASLPKESVDEFRASGYKR